MATSRAGLPQIRRPGFGSSGSRVRAFHRSRRHRTAGAKTGVQRIVSLNGGIATSARRTAASALGLAEREEIIATRHDNTRRNGGQRRRNGRLLQLSAFANDSFKPSWAQSSANKRCNRTFSWHGSAVEPRSVRRGHITWLNHHGGAAERPDPAVG